MNRNGPTVRRAKAGSSRLTRNPPPRSFSCPGIFSSIVAQVCALLLPGAITRIEEAGFSAVNYRLRLHQLMAAPLLFAAMSILAAAFSLRLTRLGGLAALAGTGVATGFAFFFFNQLCASLAQAEVVPPFAAAWTPPILALLSAFTLIFYTEDG